MSEFNGFPGRLQYTPVPNLVFSSLAAGISDIVELKVLLHVFEIIYPKKGNIRFVTAQEMATHPSVVNDLKGKSAGEIEQVLSALSAKNILAAWPLSGVEAAAYFINNEANRKLIERIRSGELSLPEIKISSPLPEPVAAQPEDIFTLYEQNIGLITPLIADELKEAAQHYPEGWLKEAFREAVNQNKRNWKYISRILERWATEGKKDGTYRGNLKTSADPDKYVRGKYGHMVQR
jgi:DnaD/phage-associated family protein